MSTLLRVYLSSRDPISITDFFLKYVAVTVITDPKIKDAWPEEVQVIRALLVSPVIIEAAPSVQERIEDDIRRKRREWDAQTDAIEAEVIARRGRSEQGMDGYRDPRRRVGSRAKSSKGG